MNRPSRIDDMSFDDYYDNSDVESLNIKEQRMQVKRWRKLKQQIT